MGYLILAFCSSAMVSVVMRLSDAKIKNNVAMLAVNYATCCLLAAATAGFDAFPPAEGLGTALLLGGINGGLYLGSFLLFQFNVKHNGIVLSSIFMKLGLLVTMVISIVLFGEIPGVLQLLGFALAVGAILLINYKPGQTMAGAKTALLALMVGGGFADGMSKIFEELGNGALSSQFLLYTFFVALILCALLAAGKKQKPGKWELLYGMLIGVPNYYSSGFLLQSLQTVPGVVAYPVYSVAGILLVTLAGVLLFREKLEKRQWAALAIILAALVLLNV